MRSTGVLLGLAIVVIIAFGMVTAGAVIAADRAGADLTASLAWGGVAIAAALLLLWLAIRRIKAILAVAERLGEGDLGTIVDKPGDGLLGRLERAVNAVSAKLTETHNAATTDLLTQVSNRGTILSTLFTEVDRAVRHG